MRTEYFKLVRDHIPDIIRSDRHAYDIVTMDEDEYRQALREKLVEEAHEAANANPQKLITELADLYEVIDALEVSYGIKDEEVRSEQERRHAERGGFERRIKLLWIE